MTDIEDLKERLRNLIILDEVGSDNPLGREAAEALTALEVERDAAIAREVYERLRAEAAEAEVVRLKAEVAGPLPPHAGDLWWDANDGESGYTDPYEAYEAVTDWTGNDYPVELSRGRSLPHVWAVRVTLTRDDAGDPDDTEVQLFNTEAEAQAALQPDQGET